MQLVDEEDDVPLGLLHLVEHGLQPLLKLPAVLSAGHQGAHVQGKDGLVLQRGGHIPLDDPLGQAFGDGGFAHAGLADEDGVVLALAAEDANDVADLVIPADDGVQLVLPGPLHQVGAILLQSAVGLLGVVRSHPLVAPHRGEGLEGLLFGDLIVGEHPAQVPAGGVQQAQEEVFHGGVFVLHLPGDLLCPVQGLFGVGGDVDPAGLMAGGGHPGLPLHQVLHRCLEGGDGDPHPCQQLGDEAFGILEEGPQQVGLLNLGVAVLLGDGLGRANGLGGFLGQFFCIHQKSLLSGVGRWKMGFQKWGQGPGWCGPLHGKGAPATAPAPLCHGGVQRLEREERGGYGH